MSASEKLKALEELDASTGIGHIKACTALRNALPQIVAVVEAAEPALDELEDWIREGKYGDDDWYENVRNLRAALAALDEALA